MKSVRMPTEMVLKVGHPETEEEFEAMFRLRSKEYKRRKYITVDSDFDEYDLGGKCVYFIAKLQEEIVGTVRLIMADPLPTELYFDFEEPLEMRMIPKGKRTELSRLIAVAGEVNYLVLWNLIKAILEFSEKNDFQGGYSFIKRGLERIIQSMGIPLHVIDSSALRYSDSLLHGYFYHGSPVKCIYYLRDEIIEAINKKEAEMISASY